MAIQLELYQWISLLITILCTVVTTIKLLWARIEQNLNSNFDVLQQKLDDVSKQSEKNQEDIRNLEREFYQFLIEMPHRYVAREDYIRGQTVLESKLDALAAKIENVQIRQGISQK